MRQLVSKWVFLVLPLICGAFVVSLWNANPAQAMPFKKKRKLEKMSSNSPTGRLFNILNSSLGGKLDLYLLAGIYSPPSKPGTQSQQVLHVTYDQSLFFGRFTIHMRDVAKLNPQQLIVYTPKQIFDFASQDAQEFEKINPGPFGGTGDLYLASTGASPPAVAPITDEVRQQYDALINLYIMPAVEKQAGGKS
ncbi:MAG: hypothetical protein ACRD22_01675 [Terriglobia bacterium]